MSGQLFDEFFYQRLNDAGHLLVRPRTVFIFEPAQGQMGQQAVDAFAVLRALLPVHLRAFSAPPLAVGQIV